MTITGWNFDEAGRFGNCRAGGDYAKRNGIDPRDIRAHDRGNGVEIEIHRSVFVEIGQALIGRTHIRLGGAELIVTQPAGAAVAEEALLP